MEDAGYVDLENFQVAEMVTGDPLLINASDHVTVNQFMDWVAYGAAHPTTAPRIHIAGGSSYVTVTRASEFNAYRQTYVKVDGGGSHITVADSAFNGSSGTVVDVVDTPDTEITGNTFMNSSNSTVISLTGTSPDSTVENDVVTFGSSLGTHTPTIVIGDGATPGTTVDYNVVRPTTAPAYRWGADDYASSAAFSTASGQGAHDIYAAPHLSAGGNALELEYDSPGINSADAAAPGEQATDIDGQGCVRDPSYPVTGAGTPAYCSRGSFQYQDPLSGLLTATPSGSMSVQADATKSHGLNAVTGYSFDFGDGSDPVVNSTGRAAHSYAHSGRYPVTVTVTDSTGATNTSAAAYVSTLGADFTAMAPVRVLDTRTGLGTGAKGTIRAGSSVAFAVPADAALHALQAVALNVTVTSPTASGFVGVGGGTSSLNYTAGRTVAATVIARPSYVNGQPWVELETFGSGTLHLVADMSGFFATDATGGYRPISPVRLLDTRTGTGGSSGLLTAARPDVLTVAGAAGGAIPSSHVTAVAANLTVTQTSGSGQVTAYPDGIANPGTSNINYTAGQTLSNFAIIPVGADGRIDFANSAYGTAQLVVDVVGYFDSDGGSGFVVSDPYRDIDTRGAQPTAPCNSARGAIGSGRVLTANLICPTILNPPTGLGNVTAVMANSTVAAPSSAGFLTVYPAGTAEPVASTVNWQHAGQAVANLTFAGTGTAGAVSFADRWGTTQLVVDVYGYFADS
ncbi:MAG: PKD domain-containing protein [Streptomyces sp.]|nr:PKD domain-containing protein [Streptomyces sp.]